MHPFHPRYVRISHAAAHHILWIVGRENETLKLIKPHVYAIFQWVWHCVTFKRTSETHIIRDFAQKSIRTYEHVHFQSMAYSPQPLLRPHLLLHPLQCYRLAHRTAAKRWSLLAVFLLALSLDALSSLSVKWQLWQKNWFRFIHSYASSASNNILKSWIFFKWALILMGITVSVSSQKRSHILCLWWW